MYSVQGNSGGAGTLVLAAGFTALGVGALLAAVGITAVSGGIALLNMVFPMLVAISGEASAALLEIGGALALAPGALAAGAAAGIFAAGMVG